MSKEYIVKVAERSGLIREKFIDAKVPSSLNNLVVVPFFGDINSEFIFSTLVLNKWKELNKFSYLIVCSWNGHSCLYPYADEFWALNDQSYLPKLVRSNNGFCNKDISFLEKSLLRYLDNPQLMFPDDPQIKRLYNNGISAQYLKEYSDVLYTLPTITSSSNIQEHSEKKSILIMPTLYIYSWSQKTSKPILTNSDFWIYLIKKLEEKYSVVVYQNCFTHDLRDKVDAEILHTNNIMTLFSAMRQVDCVIDVFNQVAKYAYIARAPVLVLDERQRYYGTRSYEIDDLCANDIPKRYSFSFAPIVDGDKNFIIDIINTQLDDFISKIDKYNLPSTMEYSDYLSYSNVRKKDIKQVGLRFVIPSDLDDE